MGGSKRANESQTQSRVNQKNRATAAELAAEIE
jgi:hypothetical protein